MPQVNQEQRQQAKVAAANAAVAANDAAVAIGVTGTVAAAALVATGVGAFAGVGVGAALMLGSFGAWYIGNRYQRLANDPPRDDFDVIGVAEATSLIDIQSRVDAATTAVDLAVYQLILADALDHLVTALERQDGALMADDENAAAAQAEAVRRNAATAAFAQSMVVQSAATLNNVWSGLEIGSLDTPLEEVQSAYLEHAGPPHRDPQASLVQLLSLISGLDEIALFANLDPQENPVMALSELPERPDTLFPESFFTAAADLAAALEGLVTDDFPNS
jgi:hypothetical protein